PPHSMARSRLACRPRRPICASRCGAPTGASRAPPRRSQQASKGKNMKTFHRHLITAVAVASLAACSSVKLDDQAPVESRSGAGDALGMGASRGSAFVAATCVAVAALAGGAAARAGLFGDDEARRAILDLRKQLEQSNGQARARQNEQMTAMSTQIDQLKRSILDLNGSIEAQRADNAKVRGQIEELSRVVAELQRKQL